MMLITDQYQDTDWKIMVAWNVVINLKWDEVIIRIRLIWKPSESLMNTKEVKVICSVFTLGNPITLKSPREDSNYFRW